MRLNQPDLVCNLDRSNSFLSGERKALSDRKPLQNVEETLELFIRQQISGAQILMRSFLRGRVGEPTLMGIPFLS